VEDWKRQKSNQEHFFKILVLQYFSFTYFHAALQIKIVPVFALTSTIKRICVAVTDPAGYTGAFLKTHRLERVDAIGRKKNSFPKPAEPDC